MAEHHSTCHSGDADSVGPNAIGSRVYSLMALISNRTKIYGLQISLRLVRELKL